MQRYIGTQRANGLSKDAFGCSDSSIPSEDIVQDFGMVVKVVLILTQALPKPPPPLSSTLPFNWASYGYTPLGLKRKHLCSSHLVVPEASIKAGWGGWCQQSKASPQLLALTIL